MVGHTKSGKTAGLVAGGAEVALGAALIASAHGDSCSGISCDGYVGDYSPLIPAALGAILLTAGSIGVIANVVSESRPESVATVHPAARTGTQAVVTAPGLQPAAVTIHAKSVVARD
jgi:hypothetical protein